MIRLSLVIAGIIFLLTLAFGSKASYTSASCDLSWEFYIKLEQAVRDLELEQLTEDNAVTYIVYKQLADDLKREVIKECGDSYAERQE